MPIEQISCKLKAALRQPHCGEQWSVSPILASADLIRTIMWGRFWEKQFKRLERLTQHGGILLSVVPKPSFPKSECANAVIWRVGFAIGDDVFDVLTRTQAHATSEKLLCSNRSV